MHTKYKPLSAAHTQKFILPLLLALLLPLAKAAATPGGGVVFKGAGTPLTGTVTPPGQNPGTLPLIAGNSITYDVADKLPSPLPVLAANHPPAISHIITFSILDEQQNGQKLVVPQGFKATIKLDIQLGANAQDAANAPVSTQTITVSYNAAKGAAYKAKEYLVINGPNCVIVKVNTLTVTLPDATGNDHPVTVLPHSNADVRDVLLLENGLEATYYFDLKPGVAPVSFTVPASATLNAATGQLPDEVAVSWEWPKDAGNTFTQLEWTWLENELQNIYQDANNTINTGLLFANNATRIDLPFGLDQYAIPVLYDGAGKLYMRIRAVNVNPEGVATYGPWTDPHTCSFDGHNNNLNWQATTTFAEDGKRKSVVAYYDGSLRSRQTVTKDNSTGTAVTAETFYDKQGRPAIQVLPAPGASASSIIAYQAGLNRFNSQQSTTDPSDLFDMEPIGAVPDLRLDNTIAGGASQYYSPNNPEKTTGNNRNLPDAGGYPYTQTLYEPDGTGRIAAQSGVGADLKIGSGHETRYFYVKPLKEELYGLFGTEAGNPSHYFKNIVVDANGQASVSYLDMHGRTIATALAGNPANPADYPGQGGTSILNSNLLEGGNNLVKGHSVESVNTIMVLDPVAKYSFHYSLSPGSLLRTLCGNISHSYDFTYDLEIVMTNEATGDVVFDNKYPGVTSESQINITDISCPVQGSYSIRKTLTLRDDVLQTYLGQYLTPGNAVCQTLDQAIDDAYNLSPEKAACTEPNYIAPTNFCLVLGSETQQAYVADYFSRQGITSPTTGQVTAANAAYYKAVEHCNGFNAAKSHRLEDIEAAMLGDMKPYGGQYGSDPQQGLFSPVTGAYIPYNPSTSTMFTQFNIFTSGHYRSPSAAVTGVNGYVDALGNPDGSVTSAQLQNMSPGTFAAAFKTSWEKSLLPYHPEYSKLQFAKQNLQNAYDWVDGGVFAQANTFSNAQAHGLINTSITAADPLFTVTGASGFKTVMDGYLTNSWQSVDNNHSYTLWQVAYGSVMCANASTPDNMNACMVTAPAYPPGYSTTPLTAGQQASWTALLANTSNADLVWQKFKQLYQGVREQMANSFINASAGSPAAYNNDLVAQGFILHFPATPDQAVQQTGGSTASTTAGTTQWYQPSTTTNSPPYSPSQGAVNTYSAGHNAGVAAGYAQIWRNELLQNSDIAALQPGDRTNLLNLIIGTTGTANTPGTGFMGICQNAVDDAHPEGATDAALANANGFTSFEQVFAAAITQYGLHLNINCNPYVIRFPKPRGQSPEISSRQTGTVDDCLCSQYNAILQEAETADPTISSNGTVDLAKLNTYLNSKFGEAISAQLFEGLQHCSSLPLILVSGDAGCLTAGNGGTGSNFSNTSTHPGGGGNPPPDAACTYARIYTLVTPQPLPYYLVCGYTGEPTCVTCGYVSDLSKYFTDTYPLPANTAASSLPLLPEENSVLRDDEIAYNTLYANYLNYKTGQQLGWADYLDKFKAANCAISVCTGVTTPGDLTVTGDGSDQPQNGYVASHSVTLLPVFDFTVNARDLNILIDPNGSACVNANPGATVLCPSHKPLTSSDGVIVTRPCQRSYDLIAAAAAHTYQNQLNSLRDAFLQDFLAGALATDRETFTLDYTTGEYHYTLYYYDMAGGLVKTVPPKGVHPDFSSTYIASVDNAKAVQASTGELPAGFHNPLHTLTTNYRYNSLNQVVVQQTPDAGLSLFWYDRLGRLVVSQNAKQAVPDAGGHKRYSYTLYDPLGRIQEVGEKPQSATISQDITQNDAGLANWLSTDGSAGGTPVYNKTQITRTTYDIAYQPLTQDADATAKMPVYITQENLRNRVSFTEVFDNEPDVNDNNAQGTLYHASASYYTYDVHGNVYRLLQDFGNSLNSATANPMNQNGGRFKTLDYDYDLVSGKVNKVAYQAPAWTGDHYQPNADALYHRYSYDAENRLIKAETSRDDVYYEQEAAYAYYKHGPLSSTKLGEMGVQTLNYAYTLQGWLKSVNAGWDGTALPAQGMLPSPAVGFSLHYFSNDYTAIGGTQGDAVFSSLGTDAHSLYNGNIAAMAVNIPVLGLNNTGATGKPLVYNYGYDMLNRLVNMDAFSSSNSSFGSLTKLTEYHEAVTYDPNGNIVHYLRNGNTGTIAMDNLAYHYVPNTNKLDFIGDQEGAPHAGMGDIGNQGTGNYDYDEIGNMVKNDQERTSSITWTVYGKIAAVTKKDDNGVPVSIKYTYDAAGNRLSKQLTKSNVTTTTWYVRDASGNVMGIYTTDEHKNSGHLTLSEMPLYGSSRVGEIKPNVDLVTYTAATVALADNTPAIVGSFTRGNKLYELSNHLGNVLATVTDRVLPQDLDNSGTINGSESYNADVVTANDYYPFGMVMPGRALKDAGDGTANNNAANGGSTIPGTLHIEAESYAGNNGGGVENTTDVGGGQDLGFIGQGDYFDYTVTVPQAGTYTVNFRIANGGTVGSIQLRNTNGDILALSTVPQTGGWQNWVTAGGTSFTLPAGTQTLRIYAGAVNWNLNWFELVPVKPNSPPGNTAIQMSDGNAGGTIIGAPGAANTFTVEMWVNPTLPTTLIPQSNTGNAAFGGNAGARFILFPAYGSYDGSKAGMGIAVGTNGINVVEQAEGYMPALLTWAGTINGWTHIAVVYNNRTPSLYVNGVLVATGLTSTIPNVYPSDMMMGGYFQNMQGEVDEVRIWGYARTQAQLQDYMHYYVDPHSENLEAYWQINASDGTTVPDITGNGHNKTLPAAFSSTSPGATYSSIAPQVSIYSAENSYRFGFNGKENDNDIETGAQDYGMRIYDSRIGKFLSVDPLTSNYPWYTPYQFAGDKPIWMIDIDGGEEGDPSKDPSKYIYKELSVDISKMPASHKTVSGKTVKTKLRETSSGVSDNQAWYWDQVRSNKNIKWSEDNILRMDKGKSPVADDIFVEQFEAFKAWEGQVLEMHHLGQKMDIGVALPWQLHRGAGFTKLWHNFGKAFTLTMAVMTMAQIAQGDPFLVNDFTKPQEQEFIQKATMVGLNQSQYSDVIAFAEANNTRTNPQLPSLGTVGIYYASPSDILSKQFLNLTNAQQGSFITGKSLFYSDAQTASKALNKVVTHIFIFYMVKGSNTFTPVRQMQIAPIPEALMPKPKPTYKFNIRQ